MTRDVQAGHAGASPLPQWVTDTLQVGLVVLDPQGRVQLFNRWMHESSGLDAQQVEGRSIFDIFPEVAQGRVGMAIRSCLSNGMPALLSNTLHPTPFPLYANAQQQAQGIRRQQSIRIFRSPAQASEVPQVLIEVTDVSNAVRRERMLQDANATLKANTVATQAALRDTEALLSALNMHAIVAVFNGDGLLEEVNDAYCAISGYAQEELLGNSPKMVNSRTHSQDFWAAMWEDISVGRPWRGQVCNRSKKGHLYWVDTFIAPFMGAKGRPEKFIAISTDISASKRNERELIDAKELAQSAAQSKSQFLATMSHEIRTPMNAILGLLQLVQNTELTARQQDYVSKTEGAAKSLLGLLNDILDFSKIDAEKLQLERQPMELEQLMRELAVILSANVGNKEIEVLFDLDPALPDWCMGDAMRLQQILINLCGNAIKFTQSGEVQVRLEVVERSASDVVIHFAVRDSGIGIAPEHQQLIFSGFSQAEASTTRRFGGTGLGLAISKRLVALMGGNLTLQSAVGVGSTFHFTVAFPLAAKPVKADKGRLVLGAPVPVGMEVLVVDDNAVARNVAAAMAQDLGWQVSVAASGAEALRLVSDRMAHAQPAFQALFVDARMPGMDGWQTLAQLLPKMATDQPPVVVVMAPQGLDTLEQRSAAERASVHAVLTKPFTAGMLRDVVAQALAQRGQRRSPTRLPSEKVQRLKGMRLLVVEDNKINQMVAKELLQTEGASIQLADNGQLGVAAVAQAGKVFDAVLMDIQMPVMDGYEATHAIRHELGMMDLPIIAMTANAMASDREACLAAGMNDHVGKPFDLGHLIDVLNLHTGRLSQLPAQAPAQGKHDTPAPQTPDAGLLDMEGALVRMGGNAELLARTLRQFTTDLKAAPGQLDALLTAANMAGLRSFLHTIKGLSATVGAVQLSGVAKAGEQKAVAALPVHAWVDWSVEFGQAVNDTLAAIQRNMQSMVQSAVTQPAAPAEASPVDTEQRVADLSLLRTLLQTSNLQALEVHQRMARAASASAAQEPELVALGEAVQQLNFAAGLVHCEALLRMYGKPVA